MHCPYPFLYRPVNPYLIIIDSGDIMLNVKLQAAGGGGDPMFFVTLILMFGIFWFFIIRPQNKKMREHQEKLQAITRGDTVVTQGGLVGKVVKAQDDELTIELGEGVRVKAKRMMMADVVGKPAPANDQGKAAKK